MGTWGAGNRDSDYALDELSERARDLIGALLLRWQRSASQEYDEHDHTTLFVELELVSALDAKHLIPTGRYIPEPAAVRALVARWLVGYDAYQATQPWPERRAVIVATFEHFVEMCERLEGEGALPSPPPRPRPSAVQATAPATMQTRPAKRRTTAKQKTKAKTKAKAPSKRPARKRR